MDIREHLFGKNERQYIFTVSVTQKGVLAGTEKLLKAAGELKLKDVWAADEGSVLGRGDIVFIACGNPFQVIEAEERLLGLIGKPSGVATASRSYVEAAGDRIRIVCGAWKKVSPEIKDDLRKAIAVGGAGIRIIDEPFVYLDKNYVRLFGGIGNAVRRAADLQDRTVVVQLRGEYKPIHLEAQEAVEAGAGIIMVDTGNITDLKQVTQAGENNGWRHLVKIAFAGGIKLKEMAELAELNIDILDVGRAIIDAPLLDYRLDVLTSYSFGKSLY